MSNPFVTSAFWRMFPAGMRRRWWWFRAFDLMARHWPVFKPRRGLIVVRMDGIGDMVLFRSSLDHYAEAFKVDQSEITVVGCNSWKALAEQVFEGYRVITIDEHRFAKRPLYRLKRSLMVRKLAPKIAVCDQYMRRALMADSLVLVSGAEQSVVSVPYINGPTRAEFTWYMSQFSLVIDTGPYPTHEIVRHHQFISAIAGREIPPVSPAFNWQPAPVEVDGKYCVLNPGSNEFGRRWPLDQYFELARALVLDGHKVVFVGKADEKKAADALEVISREAGIIDMTGKTNLPGLVDLLKKAALVVSNDTGPAHLSIAVGTPTVVIVGGGHFSSFVPYPAAQTPAQVRFVFERMSCYHCFWRCDKRSDTLDSFPCVAAVRFDSVIDACRSLSNAQQKNKPYKTRD